MHKLFKWDLQILEIKNRVSIIRYCLPQIESIVTLPTKDMCHRAKQPQDKAVTMNEINAMISLLTEEWNSIPIETTNKYI